MAKKLYGAAKKAHAKRMAKLKRRRTRKNPAKRRKTTYAKRKAAARKAAATRKRKAAARSRAAKKAARTRKYRMKGGARRRKGAMKRATKRRRTVSVTVRNPARRRRRKTTRRKTYRRRRNPRPTTQSSLKRARRSIRNKYKTGLAKYYKRRFKMRSNPIGGLKDAVKAALPIAVGMYGARFLSNKLVTKVPGINRLPAQAQGPVMSGLVVLGVHFLSKKVSFLKKHQANLMVGAGINLLDSVLKSFAPASVKPYLGLGEYVDITGGMGEYLDVDSGMGEYVQVGGVEEELGLEEELGVEADLGGALDREYLGGVAQSSMLKPVPSMSMVGTVPQRSFTKQVPGVGAGFDDMSILYKGIFSGGFGA